MKNRILSFLLTLLVLAGFVLSLGACDDLPENPNVPPDPPQDQDDQGDGTIGGVDLVKLVYFLQTFEEYSYQGFPEGVDLTEYIIESLLAISPDRYDTYLTEEEYQIYDQDLTGNVVGIGILVEKPADTENLDGILILDAFADSGAYQAGLRGGDTIVSVNGKTVRETGYETAVSSITGQSGTTVEIGFTRGSDPTVRYCLPLRGTYHKNTVYAYQDGDVGYVRITSFDRVTTKQFTDAVDKLEAAGVGGIVFDLRGNGGGLVRTVAEMLAYLLPDGKIASIDYKSSQYTDYEIYSKDGALYMGDGAITSDTMGNPLNVEHELKVPCVVLTNGSTASASELFASALRETSRGENPGVEQFVPVTLVGGNTFGKGTMQTVLPFTDGSQLKLTVAAYNPPSGNNYDGVGLPPDEKREDTLTINQLYLIDPKEDAVRVFAIELLKK